MAFVILLTNTFVCILNEDALAMGEWNKKKVKNYNKQASNS